MVKRSVRRANGGAADGMPRLGAVVRFTPQASRSGIKQMEAGGFRVASSRDFKAAAAVPNDFAGADASGSGSPLSGATATGCGRWSRRRCSRRS